MSVALTNTRPGRAIQAPGAASETSTDEVLLARIADGDRTAMCTLYARYHVAVYRFVLRMISDAKAAEALVSEVFFEAWRQAPRLRVPTVAAAGTSVSTWLLAIARNKARAIQDERAATNPAEFPREFVAGTVGRTDDQVLPEQGRDELLRRALDCLSAEQREVIDLVYYHRRSVADVAEIVGVADATVKARVLDARRRLAELIKGCVAGCGTLSAGGH